MNWSTRLLTILALLPKVIKAFGGGVFSVVLALPSLIGIVQEIIAIVNEAKTAAERTEKTKQLKEALRDARAKKDATKLTEIFNGKAPEVPPTQ